MGKISAADTIRMHTLCGVLGDLGAKARHISHEANLAFPIGWLIDGIVHLTGLFLLTPLTHLKLDWINFGTIKIFYMILAHSCREPEVVVKCCVINFNNLVYCKVISMMIDGNPV